MRAILGHQQPAGKLRFHAVEACADSRGRKLRHMHVDVAGSALVGATACGKRVPKRRCCEAPSHACALHQRMKGHRADSEHELSAQTCPRDRPCHLECRLALDRCHQRDEAIVRKVHMARWLAGLTQHSAELQLHRLGDVEQRRAISAREQSDQTAFGGVHDAVCAHCSGPTVCRRTQTDRGGERFEAARSIALS